MSDFFNKSSKYLEMKAEIAKLREVNKELLEACKDTAESLRSIYREDDVTLVMNLEDAIAKAEGKDV